MSDLKGTCCLCPLGSNRCNYDECPCFSSGKRCAERCESKKWRYDCLNQLITRCSCSRPSPKSATAASSSSSKANSFPSATNSSSRHTSSEIAFCNSNSCECILLGESCSLECACARECPNIISPYLQPKSELPTPKGCRCAGGKKSCAKSQKCICKQSLEHCNTLCKCISNGCTNTVNHKLNDKILSCFAHPDHPDITALIAKLTTINARPDAAGGGVDAYQFQMAFMSADKNEHAEELFYKEFIKAVSSIRLPQIEKIELFLLKSPCFHQDCEPKCEILEQCDQHRACAKLIRAALQQCRKFQMNSNISMSVKFLCPYVKRGDLYTRQALTSLLEVGINVEPLNPREWSAIMIEKSLLSDESQQQQQQQQAIGLWSANNMERYTESTQHYINLCRRAHGLAEKCWASTFHEFLKSAIVSFGATNTKMHLLNRYLHNMSSTAAGTPVKRCTNTATYASGNQDVGGADQVSVRSKIAASRQISANREIYNNRMQQQAVSVSEQPFLQQLEQPSPYDNIASQKLKSEIACISQQQQTEAYCAATMANKYYSSYSNDIELEKSYNNTFSGNNRAFPKAAPSLLDNRMMSSLSQNVINNNQFIERLLLKYSSQSINESDKAIITQYIKSTIDQVAEQINRVLLFLDRFDDSASSSMPPMSAWQPNTNKYKTMLTELKGLTKCVSSQRSNTITNDSQQKTENVQTQFENDNSEIYDTTINF